MDSFLSSFVAVLYKNNAVLRRPEFVPAQPQAAVKVLVRTESIAQTVGPTHVSSAFQMVALVATGHSQAASIASSTKVVLPIATPHMIEMRQAHDEWCKATLVLRRWPSGTASMAVDLIFETAVPWLQRLTAR